MRLASKERRDVVAPIARREKLVHNLSIVCHAPKPEIDRDSAPCVIGDSP
jgi:hypothetical protein